MTAAVLNLANRAVRRLAAFPMVGRAFAGDEQQSLARLAKFLLVGSSGVVVNLVCLYVLHGVLGLPLILATVLAVEVAIVNNFIINDSWTFGRGTLAWHRFVRFNGVSLVGLVLTTVLTVLLAEGLGLHYLVANVFAVGTTTSWNFIANSLWTWA